VNPALLHRFICFAVFIPLSSFEDDAVVAKVVRNGNARRREATAGAIGPGGTLARNRASRKAVSLASLYGFRVKPVTAPASRGL
jgi:hypothetical protein